MAADMLPLFPLNLVLFPGCRTSLQIFEPRYLRMVADCLKAQQPFVIVLIRKGKEVGMTPDIHDHGTLANIVDWNQLENGLLGITAEGVAAVNIKKPQVQDDGLLVAQVQGVESDVLKDHRQLEPLSILLKSLVEHPFVAQQQLNLDYRDLNAVLWQLCGLLPFTNQEKQQLLEYSNSSQRLAHFNQLLKQLQGD